MNDLDDFSIETIKKDPDMITMEHKWRFVNC